MVDTLTDVVLIVTGFQLLLLARVLLVRVPAPNLRRNLLAAFLLAKAFLILRWFSIRFDLVEPTNHPTLYLASCAVFFLLAPLLYLVVRSLCVRDFHLGWADTAHGLPFVAMAALGAVTAGVAFSEGSTGSLALDQFLDSHFWDLFWTANLSQIPMYILAMFRDVRRHRVDPDESRTPPRSVDLGWLSALLVVISLHWVFVSSRATLWLLDVRAERLTAALDLFSILIFLVFTTALVVRGMAHVRAFPGLEYGGNNGSTPSREQLQECSERLRACMKFERPFLDPSLTVDLLAARLGTPTWLLSRVINSEFGQNFFNFINVHRVEEAKRQLGNSSRNDITMLQVLHEAGFNSKSTFNDAFKRHTGMTPSEYRRREQRPSTLEGLVVER